MYSVNIVDDFLKNGNIILIDENENIVVINVDILILKKLHLI